MNLLESTHTSSRSGRSTPSLFSRSPASSFGGSAPPGPSSLTLGLAVTACVLLIIQTLQGPTSSSSFAASGGRQGNDKGIAARDLALQHLVTKKVVGLLSVRTQLQSAVAGNEAKDSSLLAQEAAIARLRQRSASLRSALGDLQVELSKVLLQEEQCRADRRGLEVALATCGKELALSKLPPADAVVVPQERGARLRPQ